MTATKLGLLCVMYKKGDIKRICSCVCKVCFPIIPCCQNLRRSQLVLIFFVTLSRYPKFRYMEECEYYYYYFVISKKILMYDMFVNRRKKSEVYRKYIPTYMKSEEDDLD